MTESRASLPAMLAAAQAAERDLLERERAAERTYAESLRRLRREEARLEEILAKTTKRRSDADRGRDALLRAQGDRARGPQGRED
jgi:hypothetical protein